MRSALIVPTRPLLDRPSLLDLHVDAARNIFVCGRVTEVGRGTFRGTLILRLRRIINDLGGRSLLGSLRISLSSRFSLSHWLQAQGVHSGILVHVILARIAKLLFKVSRFLRQSPD